MTRLIVTANAETDASEILDYLEHVLAFAVENPSGVGSYMPKTRVGVISPRLNWEMKRAGDAPATVIG